MPDHWKQKIDRLAQKPHITGTAAQGLRYQTLGKRTASAVKTRAFHTRTVRGRKKEALGFERKNMNIKKTILLILVLLCVIPMSAYATTMYDTVLEVDLTRTNEITISATDGLSDSTTSLFDDYINGFYLAFIFKDPRFQINAGNSSLVSGNLTSANQTSNNDPMLVKLFNDSYGLAVLGYADYESSFTEDSLAFTGSATWTIDSDIYAALLAGNRSGYVIAPADCDNDLVAISDVIGSYTVTAPTAAGTVPEPATMMLFGIGLLGLAGAVGKKQL